jgi:prolyl oligopeptidase
MNPFGIFPQFRRGVCLGAAVAIVYALSLQAAAQTGMKPPESRRDDVKEVIHGVTIADPYRWLEDRQSPATQAWIEAQNKYTESVLSKVPGREALRRRLTELLRVDTLTLPRERHERYFFARRGADQDLFVIYMREGENGKDQVLIDPHPLSPDHTTSVNLWDVSEDGSLLAYGLRRGGQDEQEIHFFDVNAHRDIPDVLSKADYFSVDLRPDGKGVYYVRFKREIGPRVFYHAMGTDPSEDKLIFGEGYGPEKIIETYLSEDGHYLEIEVEYGSSADKVEVYVQDAAQGGPIRTVVKDVDARFTGEVAGHTLYLLTNWKAPRNRIFGVDLTGDVSREHWRELIPESDAVIDSVYPVGGELLVNYIQNVTSRVAAYGPEGAHLRDIPLPALGTAAGIRGRWSNKEAFLAYGSYHIPYTIYRLDLAKKTENVWARQKVPVKSSQFEVKQVWFESKGRTRVPMFLVYLKGLKLDGSNPVLMTGYGGFNVSMTPWFSATAVTWAEQGGVYAEVNLRGGGEFGEEWHKAGMLDKKQNVFDDFIAAAESLVQNRYTNSHKIAIEGASNGGLLVGAVITQRPDLFRAAICAYPLLDMLRYDKFLVARFWVPEYGSAEDPAQFKYLYGYSPYQHVRRGTKYPAVIFLTGDSDTRVDPLHARKMTAMMQWATGSDHPVLLRYDTTGGHSGGRSLTKQIDETTDGLIFLYWQLGFGYGVRAP